MRRAMKQFLYVVIMMTMTVKVTAQVEAPKNTPELEFALQLKVTLGEAFSINNTQHGRRTVIPITGGTFEGPGIKGTIINGGADYQIANADGRTELEAIYCIRTDDGIYIHVRNRGIICSGKDANGNGKVVGGTLLLHIGRGHINHHSLARNTEAILPNGGGNALLALLHGAVRQSHQCEVHAHLHAHLHRHHHRVYPADGTAKCLH